MVVEVTMRTTNELTRPRGPVPSDVCEGRRIRLTERGRSLLVLRAASRSVATGTHA